MCEHCKKDSVSGRYAEPDEQIQCETSEEDSPRCPEKSLYVVFDKHVEHHLCEDHLTDERNEYFGGKGELLVLAGEEGVEFERIEGTAPECDFLIMGPPVHRCGGRSTHAKIVVDAYSLCPSHAEDMGFSIKTN